MILKSKNSKNASWIILLEQMEDWERLIFSRDDFHFECGSSPKYSGRSGHSGTEMMAVMDRL